MSFSACELSSAQRLILQQGAPLSEKAGRPGRPGTQSGIPQGVQGGPVDATTLNRQFHARSHVLLRNDQLQPCTD